jgi:hypothetical protein
MGACVGRLTASKRKKRSSLKKVERVNLALIAASAIYSFGVESGREQGPPEGKSWMIAPAVRARVAWRTRFLHSHF